MRIPYLLFSCANSERIIKNANFSPCRNCKFYKPEIYHDFTSPYSKCMKFGEMDLISSKITHTYAELCRNDEAKCGIEGKYFVEEPQPKLNIKIFIHNILKPINMFWSMIVITNVFTVFSNFWK